MNVVALGAWRIRMNLSSTLTTAKIAALAIDRKIQSMAAHTMARYRSPVNMCGSTLEVSGGCRCCRFTDA